MQPCDHGSHRARVCLALACGLPGAGKTCLCKALLAVTAPSIRVEHVCFDKILESAPSETGSNVNDDMMAYKASRRQALGVIEQCMLECAQEKVEQHVLILADDNMYYRSMRYECAQLARKHKTAFMQIYLPCSLSDALARNDQRTGQERVPEAVVRRMADRLEAPDPSHNDWERNTAVLPSEKLPPLEAAHEWVGIWQGVLARWGPSLPDAQAPRKQALPTEASASSAHTLDLQLRRMLADAIAELDTTDAKSAAARELNAVRKQLLARVCSGDKTLEEHSEEILRDVTDEFEKACYRAKFAGGVHRTA